MYPHVLNELDTLRAVVAGASIARYGDGEFKIARWERCKSQEHHPGLSVRMREILHRSGDCLVGIPNILSETPKKDFWNKFRSTGHDLLLPNRSYVSSFITRPDSAPWIDTPEYWALLAQLWQGQSVTLVRGSGKSLTAERLMEWGAGQVTEIMGPRQHAWTAYHDLMEKIATTRNRRVLLCLGPTATVMAVDLCAKGYHAIDLGHVGMFVSKKNRGESLGLVEPVVAA